MKHCEQKAHAMLTERYGALHYGIIPGCGWWVQLANGMLFYGRTFFDVMLSALIQGP